LLNFPARTHVGCGCPQRQQGRKSRRAHQCAAACVSANYFFAGAEVGVGRGEDVGAVVVPDLLLLPLTVEVFICA
jgi:hypothetical protein